MFPARPPERLAADLPSATLRRIEDSCTASPEDQPVLTRLILGFTRSYDQPPH